MNEVLRAAIQEIKTAYPLDVGSVEETNALWKGVEAILRKHLLPLETAPAVGGGTKKKTETGKARAPNYYARLQSYTSSNDLDFEGEYRYSPPDPTADLSKSQIAWLAMLEANPTLAETLETVRFTSLRDTVAYLKDNTKLEGMVRTAIIWRQFMPEETKEAWRTYVREHEPQPHAHEDDVVISPPVNKKHLSKKLSDVIGQLSAPTAAVPVAPVVHVPVSVHVPVAPVVPATTATTGTTGTVDDSASVTVETTTSGTMTAPPAPKARTSVVRKL